MNSSAIHPDDFLHKFILRKFPKDGADRYFEGGKREATAVRAMIERYFPPHSPIRVIDFAAGYGRVVRHLPVVMPKATVAASDIHPQACQFMREYFDIEVYQSTREPEELDLGDSYDFIYVHSLFSHLPPHSFQRWLAALYRHTKPGGYLMVTTNGDFARENYLTSSCLATIQRKVTATDRLSLISLTSLPRTQGYRVWKSMGEIREHIGNKRPA